MATISSLNLSTPRPLARMGAVAQQLQPVIFRMMDQGKGGGRPLKWGRGRGSRLVAVVGPVRSGVPEQQLSEKVAESVKQAEETCASDPASGECVAAWDEVEELSAAASHARDRKKDADVLEEFCKDNPETEECRTYDN